MTPVFPPLKELQAISLTIKIRNLGLFNKQLKKKVEKIILQGQNYVINKSRNINIVIPK